MVPSLPDTLDQNTGATFDSVSYSNLHQVLLIILLQYFTPCHSLYIPASINNIQALMAISQEYYRSSLKAFRITRPSSLHCQTSLPTAGPP